MPAGPWSTCWGASGCSGLPWGLLLTSQNGPLLRPPAMALPCRRPQPVAPSRRRRVFVSWVCHIKGPQTGWLPQHKFILSWFWRLRVQSQGTGGVGSFREDLVAASLLASGSLGRSSAAGGRVPPASSHLLPSVCVCLTGHMYCFYTDMGYPGVGPTVVTSFLTALPL